MYTLGWTDNSGPELFTVGWIDADGLINGLLDATISPFAVDLVGQHLYVDGRLACSVGEFDCAIQNREPREQKEVWKLAKILNESGRSTVHANPVIARLADRLKRGPGGPRFH